MSISKIPLMLNKTIDFTSSGTWTCPGGVYSANFLVVGAGGGGGCADNSVNTRYSSGGGGGGGAVKQITLPTTPGTSYTITIGAKGTGTTTTAGGNGGYSEVADGANVLIRSYGGMGGQGVDALNAVLSPTIVKTLAGGGGQAASGTSANNTGGGGGGANLGTIVDVGTNPYYTPTTDATVGLEGTFGKASQPANNDEYLSTGSAGINGYGAGGGGGVASSPTVLGGAAPYGAGNGGFSAGVAGAYNGSNALANTGGGGGGGASRASTDAASGGNGADGLVRISYVA